MSEAVETGVALIAGEPATLAVRRFVCIFTSNLLRRGVGLTRHCCELMESGYEEMKGVTSAPGYGLDGRMID